ncbi:MAG: FG-GAP repeat domain-containing protein [Planctomycetota bacterium]
MYRWTHFVLGATLLVSVVRAHEQSVHLRITQDALRESQHLERALKDAGIDDIEYGLFEIDGTGYVRAASEAIGHPIEGQSAHSLIQAGSILEDGVGASSVWSGCNFPNLPGWCTVPQFGEFAVFRCGNHFQDPSGRGLSGIGEPAGRWAYDSANNGHTWLSAITYFTAGALHEDPDQRRRRLEHVFVTLGSNLHLIQDQFSPAHTRDDAHPSHHLPAGNVWGGASLLEDNGKRYILPLPHPNNLHPGVIELPFAGTHAEFFERAVAWTNAHFFSDDTIFAYYPRPAASETHEQAPACADASSLQAYIRSTLAETWSTKLASQTIFETPRGFETGYSLVGIPCDVTDDVPAVDRVIHDNLKLLVPEAIGYSAALLDHFFRGRVDVIVEPGALRVTNRTEPVAGTSMDGVIRQGSFVVVVEFPDGRRKRLGSLALPAAGVSPGEALVVPHQPVPPEALTDGRATLFVCLAGGHVGGEPAVLAAQAETGAACDQVCSDPESHPVFGAQVFPHGDLDEDGADELMIVDFIDPFPDPGPNTIKVRAWSPSRCEDLWRVSYASYGAEATVPGARIGDLDNDGVEDWFARDSDATHAAQVSLRSGRDGSFVRSFTALPVPVNLSAGQTVPLDDIDGDGYTDIAAGNRFLSGWDGHALLPAAFHVAPQTRRIGDMNGDAYVDLGWSLDAFRNFTNGRTGAAGTWPTEPLPEDDPLAARVWLQGFTLGFVRDADGDSVPDFLRFGGGLDDELEFVARTALVSGRTGVMIWSADQPVDTLAMPHVVGDHDGDGNDDVLMVVTDSLGVTQATAYSGADGLLIGDLTPLFSMGYGRNKGLTPVGDCNGDRRTDFLFALETLDGGGECVRLIFAP